jgi:hypothetical protein
VLIGMVMFFLGIYDSVRNIILSYKYKKIIKKTLDITNKEKLYNDNYTKFLIFYILLIFTAITLDIGYYAYGIILLGSIIEIIILNQIVKNKQLMIKSLGLLFLSIVLPVIIYIPFQGSDSENVIILLCLFVGSYLFFSSQAKYILIKAIINNKQSIDAQSNQNALGNESNTIKN